MTDRDLYMCGDFHCDGHARSNERCEVDVDIPTYTVSGNHLTITRLDPKGNLIGEPTVIDGPVSFTLDACDVIDARIDDADGGTVTLDVDPNQTRLDSLFMGGGQ